MLTVYIVLCLLAGMLSLVVNLTSPKPANCAQHARRIGRLLVLAGVLESAAGAARSGTADVGCLLLVVGVAVLMGLQLRIEARRQKGLAS